MSKKLAYGIAVATFLGGLLFAEVSREYLYAQESKGPKWSHGLMLRVRKADQPDFDKNTPKVGVEVFVDENNGNLIYITEGGGIAVVKK